jgi:ComF family protein
MFNLTSHIATFSKSSCVLCNVNTDHALGLCKECWQDLPWQAAAHCAQCGLATQSNICGSCLSHPPFFDHTRALFEYAYPIDALLQAFKYQHQLHLGHLFAQIGLNHFNPVGVDCMVSMPMHPKRLQERGFNQSLELAKGIAKLLQLPLMVAPCKRIKNTPPQASLPLKDRVKNIKGAFSCGDDFQGKHVAIVDDVMTSGASLNELAKTLKQAGASEVSCWIIARTH